MTDHIEITYRPFTWVDLQSTVDLINRYSVDVVGVPSENLDSMTGSLKMLGEDLPHMVTLAENPEGTIVGYSEMYDVSQPHVKKTIRCYVDPEHRNEGIGEELVRRLEMLGRERVTLAPAGTQVELLTDVNENNLYNRSLFESRGWARSHTNYWMMIDFCGVKPPDPDLSDGLIIRSLRPGEEFRALKAAHESFADHWGMIDVPFEQFSERYMAHVEAEGGFDPALWFMVLDGDEVAGVSMCSLKTFEDPDMGWINTLGVRRPWRKRGIGLALLRHSFNEMFKRGSLRVGLSVDAYSLTGATRLYERAGMNVTRVIHQYMKELRAGKDLSRQKLEE